MTRQHWRYLTLLLWLLALGLAVWTLRQLPLSAILTQLNRLQWQDWLLWILINTLILTLAIKRWQIIGRTVAAQLSLASLFLLRQAGSAVSFITPGPHFGGEPLQLYWLHQRYHLTVHQAGVMLGLDRFIETGTNIVVLLAAVLTLLATALLPVGDGLQIAATLSAVLLIMAFAVVLLLRHPLWLAQGLKPLTALLRTTLADQRPGLWLALLLSLAGWCALFLELQLLLQLLGLSPSWRELVLIMVGMRLAMLLPVPGGIGTIEASLLWSFSVLALPVSAAAGLIALIRLRDALVLLIGLGCLASLRRKAEGS